jgi:glycosidase
MSKFNLEISLDKSISIELICNECGNQFSSEIDLHYKGQELSEEWDDFLYCFYCEHPYRYTGSFYNNILTINFHETELLGRLKYSQKVEEEEYVGLTPHKSLRFYNLQIERLEKIIKLKTGEHIIDQTLFRLIYSGVITALETYLSETFIQVVFYSTDTLEKFVYNYEPFKKEKISMHEIFQKYNNLELRVRDDIDNFIFHNISKLIKIFNIFDFELNNSPQIKNISKYIQKRHNFVHKSGIVREESLEEISEKEIEELICNVNLFVNYITKKNSEKCFLPYNDDLGLPF